MENAQTGSAPIDDPSNLIMLRISRVHQIGRSTAIVPRPPGTQLPPVSGFGDSPCASIVLRHVEAPDQMRLGTRFGLGRGHIPAPWPATVNITRPRWLRQLRPWRASAHVHSGVTRHRAPIVPATLFREGFSRLTAP